jgi:hypothetical protein
VKLASGKRRAARQAYVDDVIASLPIIAYDVGVAVEHSELLAAVRKAGRPRGADDLLVAATARATDRTIVSADLGASAQSRRYSAPPCVQFEPDRLAPFLVALLEHLAPWPTWEPRWEPISVGSKGRLWMSVESRSCRFGLCGRVHTPVDCPCRSTDQKDGSSRSSGRATEIPAVHGFLTPKSATAAETASEIWTIPCWFAKNYLLDAPGVSLIVPEITTGHSGPCSRLA